MCQQSLFAVREIPEGLRFKPGFLTIQEERDLFALLETLPFYEFRLCTAGGTLLNSMKGSAVVGLGRRPHNKK